MMEVSAGVITRQGLVLICKRQNGLWEFPGGKRQPGESPGECLMRECMEELDVRLCLGGVIIELDAPTDRGTARFTFIRATLEAGEPQCLEHLAIRWVTPAALCQYTFCAADTLALPSIRQGLMQ